MLAIWPWLTTAWAWLTPQGVIAIATIVYAGVTVVMFFAIRSQARAAHRQADIAAVAAGAAKLGADAAREGVELAISKERARLKIVVEKAGPQSQLPGGQAAFNGAVCSLMNYGLTTAFVSDFRGRFCRSDTQDVPAEYARCRQLMYGESIQPASSSSQVLVPLEPSPALADKELLQIRSGKSFLHFYGFVKHRDVFDRDWKTTIHLRWTMRWGGVIQGTVTEWWEPVGPSEENKETREESTT